MVIRAMKVVNVGYLERNWEFALYKVVRKNFSEVRPEELLKVFSLGKKESFILTF